MNTAEQSPDQEGPDSTDTQPEPGPTSLTGPTDPTGPVGVDQDSDQDDDVRARFRAALEQKQGRSGAQKGRGAPQQGSAVGDRQAPTTRRTFRRKSG